MVGRPGFPGQRPSKPRRIEPASNHTTANNAANRNANNSQAASSNSGANHLPAPRPPNQASATAAGRSLQIISSSEVARSSNQGEVQTRPIEVICGPGGEASVRCEGTLSEVESLFCPTCYLICLLTGGCTPDSKSTCQCSSREFNLSASHLSGAEQATCVSGAAHGACVRRCSRSQGSSSCFCSRPPSRHHL